jgi:NADPH:quinone reductase-like Zn-dependent oxidoreductase
MKTVRIHAFGGVDVLRYEEVERPEPQVGEVLVRVRAAGVNPIDCVSRDHPYRVTTGSAQFPYTLGWDISGEVVALGEGVTRYRVGDQVYGMPRFPHEARAYSQYVTAPVGDLAHKPRGLTHQEAASIPLVGLTAWQSLFDSIDLRAGQTVLITGGSGGVGHLAIQFAKWKGARVVTTTSTRNVGFVSDLGADMVIDYTRQTLRDVIMDVDTILDTVGGEALREAFQIVKRVSTIVSLPGHAGVQAIGDELAPQHDVTFIFKPVHPSGAQLAQIASLFDAGQAKTHLEAIFPLKNVAQAHVLVESGRVRGKVVLGVE